MLPPPGAERLTWTFDAPTSVLIQDDRQWGDSFSFRLGNNGQKTYSNGVPLQVAFTLGTHEPLKLVYDRPLTLQAGAEWATLSYEKEIVSGSALDFSGMNFVDAPAGKHGWLQAQGPYFEFEKKPGESQRFYGVNFCSTANFPSAEQAEQLAARFVRLGYNSVRIHHYDQGCVQGSADGLTLNPEQMAKIDGFIAACIKHGLYVTTDLFVSRKVQWRHIGVDRDGQVEMQVFKAMIAVSEPAYQNWAAFAKAFLTHVNPYTGRRYADEPGMPFLSMVNEGSIGYANQEARETPQMQAAWRAWLAEKRAKDPAFADLPDTLPSGMSGKTGAAISLFVADTEAKMVARMRAFLRDEIGCRTPCGVAFTRLANKPFTVSEYNFSGPGMFRGVGGIMTGAMGALQDWSALWRFAYAHRLENMFDGEGTAGYFDVSTDPLSQASDRASICLFLRRDLDVAQGRVAAGPLSVDITGAPATVWVSALDAAPVTESRRLLLTHLTDVQNTGIRYAERARKTLLSWGKLPYLVRVGQAEVALALKEPGAYAVYALATSGRRLEKVDAKVVDGKLAFTASVANPSGARMLYEIVRE